MALNMPAGSIRVGIVIKAGMKWNTGMEWGSCQGCALFPIVTNSLNCGHSSININAKNRALKVSN